MPPRLIWLVLMAVQVLLYSFESFAGDADTAASAIGDLSLSDWIVSIGGSAQLEPLYDGAKKFGWSGMPSLSVRKRGEPVEFSAPDDGIDYTLFSTPQFKIGPVANIRAGRAASSDRRLIGLDNYPWTFEAGVFAEYWVLPDTLRTRLEIRHGIRDNDGFVADLSADLIHRWGAFMLSGGPRMSLADSQVMQQEYGITPVAASRNSLVFPFKADGGVRALGYNVTLTYDWSQTWRTYVYHNYDRLVDDAAESPITNRFGTRNQYIFGAGFVYSFALGQ